MTESVDREEFERALEVGKLGLAKSDLIPALQCFKLDGKKITSWNDVVSVEVDFGSTITNEPTIPNGQMLYNFVKKADGVTVYMKTDGDALHVLSDDTSMDIPIRDADEYPETPNSANSEKEWSATINAAETAFALGNCLKTVGSQKDFLVYNAVCFGTDPKTGNMTFYSSDNVSLSKYVLSDNVGEVEPVLVPKSFAQAITTAFDKFKDETESMTVSVYKHFVEVKFDSGVKLMGRRTPADIPEYDQPIDEYINNVVQSEDDIFPITQEIKSTIDRVKSLVGSGTQVKVSIAGTDMLVEASADGYYTSDRVDLPHSMEDTETKVGIDYLARAASAGDFMYISKDCVGVFNGPVDEASYTHLVASS